MDGTSFEERVRLLRLSWEERREAATLGRGRDRASQHRVLRNVHAWAGEAIADARQVYGDEPGITISPFDAWDEAFSVTVAGHHRAEFALVERPSRRTGEWRVIARVTADPGAPPGELGPERRTRHWTRRRVEDVLLTLLGAYERTRTAAS